MAPVVIAVSITLIGLTAISYRRPREILLSIVIVLSVMNFLPTFLDPAASIDAGGPWNKLLKDGLLIAVLLFSMLFRPRESQVFRFMFVPVALFALYLAASAIRPEAELLSGAVSLRYYVLYPMLAPAIYRMNLQPREIRRLVNLVVFLGVVQFGFSVVTFLGLGPNTSFEGYVSLGGNQYGRAIGTLGNPNNLGLFLGLPFLLLLHGEKHRFGHSVALGVVGLAMLLTFSRSVPIALLLTILLTLRDFRNLSLRQLRLVRIMGFALLVPVLLYLSFIGRSGSVASEPTGAFNPRAEILSNSLQDIKTGELIFGKGLGTLETISEDLQSVDQQVTDNIWLALLLELGLVGLGLFGFLVIRTIRAAAKWKMEGVSRGIYAWLVFFLLYGFVSINYRLFPNAFFYWVGLGLLATLHRHKISKAQS